MQALREQRKAVDMTPAEKAELRARRKQEKAARRKRQKKSREQATAANGSTVGASSHRATRRAS